MLQSLKQMMTYAGHSELMIQKRRHPMMKQRLCHDPDPTRAIRSESRPIIHVHLLNYHT